MLAALDPGTAWPLLALVATSFFLGARHGLDWDHIAAITDLTSPRKGDEVAPRRHGKRGLGLALSYCVGHGLVLAVFAALILLLGVGLPAGLDSAFEYVVGLTLVALGAVVLYQLGRYRSDYRYTGRISLVVGALRRGWARARGRDVAHDAFADVDRRGAFLVGLLHGTGASTPTQVVLFATTAAAWSPASRRSPSARSSSPATATWCPRSRSVRLDPREPRAEAERAAGPAADRSHLTRLAPA